MLGSLAQDARYAVRSLRRAPGFVLVASVTLALGIGAVTALFSLVNGVVLRPLPFHEPERLVYLWSSNVAEGQDRYMISPQDFSDWREQTERFEGMAAFWPNTLTLTTRDSDPERVRSALVTHDFFEVLGVPALLGGTFTPADGELDSTNVTVLGEGLWRRRFGADPEVIGSTVVLDGNPYVVRGVVAASQGFPADVDLWTPITFPLSVQGRNARWMSAIGRLRPGVTPAAALADLHVVTDRLAEENPASNSGWSATLAPLHDVVVGDTGPALLVLLGATGLILLIACANVANLLLSRSETRRREIAVRAALGAGRLRITRQLLTESLVLAAAGALVGVLLAWIGLRLVGRLGPAAVPRLDQVSVDGSVLAFALLATLATGVTFGLAPALRLVRGRAYRALREGSRGTSDASGNRLRAGFVIVELAMAAMLAVGAGLLIRSFGNLQAVDPGFEPSGLLTLELELPATSYPDDADVADLYDRYLARLGGLPGARAVSLSSSLPLGESLDYLSTFQIAGRPPDPSGEPPRVTFRQVGPGFFQTMGIGLLAGRDFDERDRADAPGVVIVNRTFVQRFFPDEDPVGERLAGTQQRFGPLGAMLHDEVEIVGVVDDVKYAGLKEDVAPSLYFPHLQAPFRRMTVTIRTGGDATALVAGARNELRQLDPSLPISTVATGRDLLSDSVAGDRFSMLLLTLFGSVALALASVGIYGVLAFNVEQRTRELGIRMALGADVDSLRSGVLRQGGALAVVGLGIGVGGALTLSRVLASQLYGVRATDPVTLVAVVALLSGVALLASYLPARRATRVDPVVALRAE